MTKRLSILVVNWNSVDYLRQCLLAAQADCAASPPEIIVVDNWSGDGCGAMLAVEFPHAIFVQSPDNLGFGRAVNLGFLRATGALLLLLNPDCQWPPGVIPCLREQFRRLPQPGILAPRLLNSDGTLQTSCVRALPTPINCALDCRLFRHWFPKSRLWGTWSAFNSRVAVEVEAVSGACMLMSASAFREAGGFSPEFFMYGEDLDLCAKMRRLGLRNYHLPMVEVVHHGGGSSQAEAHSSRKVAMLRRAGEIYLRLNRGPVVAAWYRLLQGALALTRIGVATLPALLWWGKPRATARLTVQHWGQVLAWSVGLDR